MQTNMVGTPVGRTKQDDIRQLMEANHTMRNAMQVVELIATNVTRFQRSRRPVDADRVLELAREETTVVCQSNLDALGDRLAELYDQNFTHDEVREMLIFYSSPLGRKTLEVMPLLVSSSVHAMQVWGQGLLPEIRKRMRARQADIKFEGE